MSHVYCSPYLRARAGSQHGYDIIDHGALNPEIGNRDDFERFVAELKRHGMGQILDMVPNHMGVMGRDNAWWMDPVFRGEYPAQDGFGWTNGVALALSAQQASIRGPALSTCTVP